MKSIVLALSLAWAGASFAECLDGLIRETPDEQFTLAPQWAAHSTTHLMWARCSLGTQWDAAEANCLPQPNAKLTYTWFEAIEAANQSRLGGFSDWRLPNKNELMSIADHACTGPAINERVFPNTGNASYWSSSPSALNAGDAWRVVFTTGDLINEAMSAGLRVRLVRDL